MMVKALSSKVLFSLCTFLFTPDKKDKIMDSQQLDTFLKKKQTSSNIYLGVVASDELPTNILLSKLSTTSKKSIFFIANTSRRESGGKHWVSMYFDIPKKTIELYNSLGTYPTGDILSWLIMLQEQNNKLSKTKKWQFKISSVIAQGMFYKKNNKLTEDNHCGLYATSFITRRLNGETFREASGFDNHKAKVKYLTSFGANFHVIV
jgi:hypothetical protein